MADSGSLRTTRWKRHKAGDHALCRPGCGQPPAETLAAVPDRDLDVRESLTALALRLEAAHQADPSNGIVARELRATLLAIEAGEPAAADPMDELRAMAARVS